MMMELLSQVASKETAEPSSLLCSWSGESVLLCDSLVEQAKVLGRGEEWCAVYERVVGLQLLLDPGKVTLT